MFEYFIPTKIVFGQGSINRIGDIVSEYGDKVLLVCDNQSIIDSGHLNKVKKYLEEKTHGVILFDKVSSLSNSDTVNQGADQARHACCNVVVGFGRKTTLNVAKAIKFLISYGGNLEDHFFGRRGDKQKDVAYIEIPSSHGLVPGITDSFYVVDRFDQQKKSIDGNDLFADQVVIDPQLSFTIPPTVVGTIAMEVLAMAVESYISKASTAISDALNIKAIDFIGNNLLKVMTTDQENINYRSTLSMAGVMVSMAANNSSYGTCNALALACNSLFGTHQGMVSTVLLPHMMEFNLTSAPNRYIHIARALGENTTDITVVEAAIKAVESVRKMLNDIKVPTRLSDLDVDKDRFYDVARIAKSYDFLHHLPRPVSKEDLYNILISAY